MIAARLLLRKARRIEFAKWASKNLTEPLIMEWCAYPNGLRSCIGYDVVLRSEEEYVLTKMRWGHFFQ